MRPEETKLRKQGRMTRALLEKKWEIHRAKMCLYQCQDELEKQEKRVAKLNEEYDQALQSVLAEKQTV